MDQASIAPDHQHSAQDEETHQVCQRKNLSSSKNPRGDKENNNDNSNDPFKRVDKASIAPYHQRSVHEEATRQSKRQSTPSPRNPRKGARDDQENNNGYIFDKTKAKHDGTRQYGSLSLASEEGHGLVLELITGAGGQIKRRQLKDQLYQSAKCIKDINVISNLENTASHIFTKDKARDLIMHTPTLSICHTHSNTPGKCRDNQCRDLHVCKYWWMNGSMGCPYGNNCQFGHNLDTKHNITAKKYHWVHTLSVEQIVYEMLKPRNRAAECIPTICIYYNSKRGCTKGRNGSKCSCLHICEHFVHANCKFGGHCNRCHNFRDEQPDRILRKFALCDLAHRSKIYFIQLLLKHCREYIPNDDHMTDSCESEQSIDDSYSSVATDDDDEGDEISPMNNKWFIRTKAGPLDVGITSGDKLSRSYEEFQRCKTLTIEIQGQR